MQTMHDKCLAKGVSAKSPNQSKIHHDDIVFGIRWKKSVCSGYHEPFDETWRGINMFLNIYEQDHPNARCAHISVEMVLYSQTPRHRTPRVQKCWRNRQFQSEHVNGSLIHPELPSPGVIRDRNGLWMPLEASMHLLLYALCPYLTHAAICSTLRHRTRPDIQNPCSTFPPS